jgi:hypothetical protein
MDPRHHWEGIVENAIVRARPSVRKLDLKDIYVKAASHSLYQSLPTIHADRSEIRLVHLQLGKFSDPLVCNITTSSLQANPDYEALSPTLGGFRVLLRRHQPFLFG